MPSIKVKRLTHAHDLPLPKYMSAGASGCDLHAAVAQELVLAPGQISLVPTGLCLQIPEGYEVQIRPRSGLALKHGITLVNSPGTIDSDYRGEVQLIMINLSQVPFVLKRGERVAQMVVHKVEQALFEESDSLDGSQRGEGGFGHTGR